MNEQELLHRQIRMAQRRMGNIQQRLLELGDGAPPLMDEALEELGTALEELHVTEEELRAQNEELRASQLLLAEERERYRELFHFAPDPYLVTDAEGMVREANRAASALLGVREGNLPGKPLALYVAEPQLREFRSGLRRLAHEGRVAEWELRLAPRGGAGGVDVLATVEAARGRDGEPGGLRWLLRDVTERKRAEETARRLAAEEAARERITGIVESIADGFFALDPEGRFTYLNRSAEAELERGREELLGRPVEEAFAAGEHPALHAALARAARENDVVEVEEFHPPRAAWLELRVYPAPDGLTVYFRDVTEEKAARHERDSLARRMATERPSWRRWCARCLAES